MRGAFLFFPVVWLMGCTQTPHSKATLGFSEFAATEATTSATADCREDCQKLRQEFRYVVYVGQQIYCYWDLKKAETGVDYEALAKQLELSIIDQTSISQYYRILRQWAASLHDGHVNVMAMDLSLLEVYSAPVRLEVLAPATDHEKVVVISVKDVPGVSVGDVVTAVNGIPVAQAIDQKEVLVSGSTRRMRRLAAAKLLVDAVGADEGVLPLVLTIAVPSGSKDVRIYRNVQIPSEATNSAPNPASIIEAVKILPGGVGYLRLNAFLGEGAAETLFDQVMDRFAGTSGLIIDLRRNGGGDLSGNRILGRFTKQEVVRYKRSERWSDFLLAQRADTFLVPHTVGAPFADWHDVTIKPGKRQYDKPVVVLISPYCFSACDTFSAALKDNKMATFVGEPTGGGTGTPAVFELPVSKLAFRYGVIRGQTPDGTMIEGAGTQPDVYIEPTITDRVKGEDSQLDRALQVVAEKNGQTPIAFNIDVLKDVAPIGAQSLDVSPTQVENDHIRSLTGIDEL